MKLNYFGLLALFLITLSSIQAQKISGPMLGYVEHRTARVWYQLKPGSRIQLEYWSLAEPGMRKKAFPEVTQRYDFLLVTYDLVALEPGQEYAYELVDHKNKSIPGSAGRFRTQQYWKWRNPAPDFSFLAGSCHYGNDPAYDRPGKPYGTDSTIFQYMAAEPASFMLWLGDSWYTREADYQSKWGLWYRAAHSRAYPKTGDLFRSMGHVGIWDDHDYGPNNEGLAYHLKEESREVFKAFMPNPSCGYRGEGIYTKLTYYDVDLFLLDNRTLRSADRMRDSVGGKPNPEKRMLGAQQMEWLKNSLLNSYQPFKIIVNGSQNLNQYTTNDSWMQYPSELTELLEFIQQHKISGVIFLSGDKHNSEILALKRENAYPLYDITLSSLTAGVSKFRGAEINNPQRVAGMSLEEHNYGRLSVSGPEKNRVLKVEFVDVNGQSRKQWSISENELRYSNR